MLAVLGTSIQDSGVAEALLNILSDGIKNQDAQCELEILEYVRRFLGIIAFFVFQRQVS